MSQDAIKNQYGLIGKVLTHSFSKKFFTDKFFKEHRAADYQNIEIDSAEALKIWLKHNAKKYNGLNVTIPYKESVIPFLDELDDLASSVGAVNTIKIKDNRLIGYNTDIYGFRQSIKPFFEGHHERALILGTGGAAKAVAFVLKKLGVRVAYLSRRPDPQNHIFDYADANEQMVQSFPLIVNCTPLGTYPNTDEQPNFPIHFVGEQHLVIDLIYNPPETKFLQTARLNGATTLNGADMLKHQALKAWEIWNL